MTVTAWASVFLTVVLLYVEGRGLELEFLTRHLTDRVQFAAMFCADFLYLGETLDHLDTG